MARQARADDVKDALEADSAVEQRLYDHALRYLSRYASSGAHLRTILVRHVERDHETAAALGREGIQRLANRMVERVAREGWLNDRAYAVSRARRLAQRGQPLTRIRAALLAKGLATTDVEAGLDALAEEVGDADWAAAVAFARRRRLGPWRPEDERSSWRERDMMRLARAGFTYVIARAILDAPGPDALGGG